MASRSPIPRAVATFEVTVPPQSLCPWPDGRERARATQSSSRCFVDTAVVIVPLLLQPLIIMQFLFLFFVPVVVPLFVSYVVLLPVLLPVLLLVQRPRSPDLWDAH